MGQSPSEEPFEMAEPRRDEGRVARGVRVILSRFESSPRVKQPDWCPKLMKPSPATLRSFARRRSERRWNWKLRGQLQGRKKEKKGENYGVIAQLTYEAAETVIQDIGQLWSTSRDESTR